MVLEKRISISTDAVNIDVSWLPIQLIRFWSASVNFMMLLQSWLNETGWMLGYRALSDLSAITTEWNETNIVFPTIILTMIGRN